MSIYTFFFFYELKPLSPTTLTLMNLYWELLIITVLLIKAAGEITNQMESLEQSAAFRYII